MKRRPPRAWAPWIFALLLQGGCAAGPDARTAPADPAQAAALAALPEGASPQDAAQWILRQVEAAERPPAQVESRRTVSVMRVKAMGMDITIETLQLGPDKVYARQDLPGVGRSEMGYDGQTGWSRDPMMGLRTLAGPELAELRRTCLDREGDYHTGYEGWTFDGVDTEDGRVLYVLTATPAAGDPQTWAFDAQTFRWVHSDLVSESAQGRMKVSSTVEAWQDHGGRAVASRVRTRIGPITAITELISIEDGVAIDPAVFAPPSPEGAAPESAPAPGATPAPALPR